MPRGRVPTGGVDQGSSSWRGHRATAHIGAARHERSQTRTTQRNGSRDEVVSSTAGDLTMRIPKTRTGSFFPSLLTPRGASMWRCTR